ncbi:MAG: type II secretion system protein M [Thiobacillaceae bacterium]|nr:type II secretion system protein M [Thiobacillaceae bacterium]MDW8323388.1 type II secretion system protein GspM [Burkholderiales bacterium]
MSALETLRALWQARAPRERRLILLGAALLLPVALYLYLWQPLMRAHARLEREVAHLGQELERLRAGAQELQRLRAQPGVTAPADWAAAAREAALRLGLEARIAEWRRAGDGQLQVRLEAVPSAAWAAWLGELARAGVRVQRCELAHDGAAEAVRVRLVLTGGD